MKKIKLSCLLCCFKCISKAGLRNGILKKFAYFPPKIEYRLKLQPNQSIDLKDKDLLLYDLYELNVKEKKEVLFENQNNNSTQIYFYLVQNIQNNTHTPMIYIKSLQNVSKKILIFSHGNSTNIFKIIHNLEIIARFVKVDILAYEYTGYWHNQSYPTDHKIIHGQPQFKQLFSYFVDLHLAYIFVIKKLKFHWYDIILYGMSIGSGPSCFLAANNQTPVMGIILQSPLASGLMLIHYDHLKLKKNYYDIFPNIEYCRYIKCPVLLIHGKQDKVIPIFHSQLLQENLVNCVKPLYVNADHNDVLQKNTIDYIKRMIQFIKEEIPFFSQNKSEKQLLDMISPNDWKQSFNHNYKKIKLQVEQYQNEQMDLQKELLQQNNGLTQIIELEQINQEQLQKKLQNNHINYDFS